METKKSIRKIKNSIDTRRETNTMCSFPNTLKLRQSTHLAHGSHPNSQKKSFVRWLGQAQVRFCQLVAGLCRQHRVEKVTSQRNICSKERKQAKWGYCITKMAMMWNSCIGQYALRDNEDCKILEFIVDREKQRGHTYNRVKSTKLPIKK